MNEAKKQGSPSTDVDNSPSAKGTGKKKIITKNFVILTAAYTCACIAYQFVGQLYASFATQEAQLAPAAIGAIGGLIATAGLCMRPFTAIIVDKFNQKMLLIISFLLIGVSVFGFSLTVSYNGLVIAQILRGVGFAILSVTGYVMVSKTVDKENLATALGIYMVAQVIGTSIVASLAVAIMQKAGYQTAFRVGSCFAILAIVVILFMPYEMKKENDATFLEQVKSIRLNNIICIPIIPIVFIGFLFQILQTALGSYVVAFGTTELSSVANVGIFASIANMIMWVTRPGMGRLSDKLGARCGLLIGAAGFGVTCFMMAKLSTTTGLIAAAIVYGISTAGVMPVITSLCLKAVPEELKGSAASTRAIGADLGVIVGNMIMPVVAANAGTYRTAYLLMVGVSIVVAVLALAYFAYYNKKHPNNQLGL